jgi:hypothetical protein
MNWSITQICNAALGLVGAADLVNYDDATDRSVEAVKCRQYFPLIRQVVFEAHPWKCLSQRVELAQTTTAPAWGYAYAYVLPIDYVRMVGMDDPRRRYKVQGGRVLHTDESPAAIEYVRLDPDPTHYTAMLIRCLVLNLAYELAYALPHDPRLAEAMKMELEKFFLPLARMVDSVEQGEESMASSSLTDMFQ